MRFVALLRGINVGGNNMIKMETLRATFESLGFENVKTYINSGNIIFDTTRADDKKIAKKIHDAIRADFGFDISTMVRSLAEINELIANNPYEGMFENDKDLHVFFLNEPLSAEQAALLIAQGNEAERFHITDRHILCLLSISILDSIVGKGFIDKKLKVATTARNWRTVKKIAEYQ
ncbi:MAG: DUF1697 domain-containing protein [Pyrinomonadaceae bacterium]